MTENALLAAVRAKPDDDAPRLKLAQWYEEQGDPRGQFIRLQCAENAGEDVGDALFEMNSQEQEWLDSVTNDSVVVCDFERGFIEFVVVHVKRDVQPLLQLLDSRFVSVVKNLHLTFVSDSAMVEFSNLYNFEFLESLTIESKFGDDAARAISTSTMLPRLRELSLNHLKLKASTFAALAEDSKLQLRDLSLSDSNLSNVGLKSIVESPLSARLSGLNLRGTKITAEGIEWLASSSHAGRFSELDLEGPLGDKAVQAIANSPLLKLSDLGLSDCGITTQGVKALAESPNSKNLRRLHLGGNMEIDEEGVVAIAESPNFSNLEELSLIGLNMTVGGEIAIANSRHLTSLQTYEQYSMSEDGVWAFARTSELPSLAKLYLLYTDYDADTPAGRALLEKYKEVDF